MTPRQMLAVVLHPVHLGRTGLVALLVGLWLTLFNQGTQLLVWPWSAPLVFKIAMNVITPFVVANLGLMSRQAESKVDALSSVVSPRPLPMVQELRSENTTR
ncbi:MAG: hypothetical protein ABI451_09080 [Dokdonella sp.]